MPSITFEVVDKNGEPLEVDIEYTAVCDPNYGADGDGNRGVECWSLDDYAVEIWSENVNVTKQFAIARPEEYQEIVSEAMDKALDDAASRDPEYYEDDDE